MASIEELREIRLKKRKELEDKGINVFPNKVNRDYFLNQVIGDFENIKNKEKEIYLVGRIMSKRGQGAIVFSDLFDGTDRFQIVFKKDENVKYSDYDLEDGMKMFEEFADEGDFIEVKGLLFLTKTNQPSLLVKSWKIIAKSLRPIPDAWYGIKDEDERFRKRYIDTILSPELHARIYRRSTFWNVIRNFLLAKDFVEVETPVLETKTGGAEAKPFITHHNALDIDVYLRISVGELWQKKLMVGGLPRTFEIGRIFRNEGMSHEHAQDYTSMEFYMAYSDYISGMEMIKELYREVVLKVYGKTKFSIRGEEIDFGDEWEIYDYIEIIKNEFGVNVLEADLNDLKDALEENNIQFDPKTTNRERASDLLWKVCRKKIKGPGFLINVPIFMEPLAKKSEKDNRVVERFQVLIAGSEVGKGFSELNDPLDQAERFAHQEELREQGDEEAQMNDLDYVEALEYGMPPSFGFGVSERFFCMLEDVSIREAQIFPLMRPKDRE
jgi:lysyl-tRNA synthetase class 2